ncbi:MAG: hypothetical protein LAO20_21680 [Acidobacteriia bacterium]|nr:hypothetical protein [Terriglobia bacterium]
MASSLFVGSYIAAWVLLLLLCVAILVMTRQIALLHGRILPAGAKATRVGPQVGRAVQKFEIEDIYANKVQVPSNEKNTLVLFLSEGCSVCEQLAPAIVALVRQERHISVVLATFNGDAESNKRYAKKHGLSHLPYIFSKDFAFGMMVFTAPYALLIDREGILRSKGLVNSKEHLDSLLNALDLGVSGNVEYYQRALGQAAAGHGDSLESKTVNGNGPRG